MRPALRVALLAAVTVGALWLWQRGQAPPPALRNVVVLLVDALRADRLGAYGGGDLTPRIDVLARRGWRFEHAYSAAPSTVRSVASIFTSTLPPVHRIREAPGDARRLSVLPDAFLLLPEAFDRHGYHTVMLTTAGWITPEAGYGQGVDEYLIVERHDRALVDAATSTLGRLAAGPPFFAYLHFLDLHDYYHADRLFPAGVELPESLSDDLLALRGLQPSAIYSLLYEHAERFTAADVTFLEAAYDRELRRTDRLVGELVDRLAALGLDEATLVVLVSDHGEQFGEHGLLVHGADGFYDEVLRVPWILAGPLPGRPRVVDERVSTLDLFPTLLELAGLPVPDGLQGRSRAGSEPAGGAVVATNERTWKLLDPRWSFIYSARQERRELYDLVADPTERRDLATAEPAVVALFERRLAETIRQGRRHPYARVREIATTPMSERVEETLRSLGYLD